MKRILLFAFSFFLLGSCLSTNPSRSKTLLLSKEGEASFVFDDERSNAYILADPEFLSSLNGASGKKNYSCPENSKYCSICINLKDSSVGCKTTDRDGPLSRDRGLFASKQKVTLRDVIVSGKKRHETRLIFSGYPAEMMLNRSLQTACKHRFRSCQDFSCLTDKKVVVCQALVNVAKL